jgi:hypothetical protein
MSLTIKYGGTSSRPALSLDARAGLEIHTLSYPSPARRRQEIAAVVVTMWNDCSGLKGDGNYGWG